MINNRQNGRRRGRGGQRTQGGGSQGQRDGGNRIDSRARGNASQLYEKYKNMASDSQRQGDRVTTEYYLQFADHYFRVMADQRGRYEDQGQRRAREDFDAEEDFGDEGDPVRADEQSRAGDEREDRQNRYDNRPERAERPERYETRSDRGDRQERQDNRGERAEPRGDRGQRHATPRSDEARRAPAEDRPDGDQRETGAGEPLIQAPAAEAAPAPKRRGRPRKTPVETPAEPSLGLDASALPPSLGTPAPADASDEAPAPKPRRRRTLAAPAEVTPAG